MFNFIRSWLTFLYLILNSAFWCVLIYIFALLKLLIPIESFREKCGKIVVIFAENWIACNNFVIDTFYRIRWKIQGLENLSHERSYFVTSNHQSWVDIVVLQKVLNRHIPFLRFFIKQELIYVPLLGLAWQALDFPRMKRYSANYLAKHPEKRGEDLATTRRMCEKFRGKPVSVLNFLEGTRFTLEKQNKQNSPFKNLLKPKRGGFLFTLDSMGDQFHSLLDITIFYPEGAPTMTDLLGGKVHEVVLYISEVQIPRLGPGESYLKTPAQLDKMNDWIHRIWQEKDQRLSDLKSKVHSK